MRTVLLLAAFAISAPAEAAFLEYRIELTVESGVLCDYVGLADEGIAGDCTRSPVGNVYFGGFSVEDDVVATDGETNSGTLGYFYIEIESLVWGYNWPGDNTFAGFSSAFELFDTAPSFTVVDGQVVGLRGGVFSSGDDPVVDFQSFQGNDLIPYTFAASGNLVVWPTEGQTISILESGRGAMTIAPVPAPPAVWLLGTALTAFTGRLWLFPWSRRQRA
jgi:hypothetical protein